jgi:hypothetical protein
MSSDFKSKQKGKKQISLLHGGGGCNCIKKVSKESTLLDKELLLTDAIYGKKVPEEMQGYLFHYRVTAYFTETKTFCVMYTTHMILKDGNVWKHQDGNHEPMDGVSLEIIETEIELFNRALGCINAHAREQQAAAKAVLEKANEDIKAEVVDVTDLEKAANSEPQNGWHSQVVVDLEFELTRETG